MKTRQTIYERYLHPICSAVALAFAPTWKLRMRQQIAFAEKQFQEAVRAYEEAEAEARSSFVEHNNASYWK